MALDYVQACGITGIYPAMYSSHNMHFAAVAHLLQGKYAAATRYARRLAEHVRPMAAQSLELETFLPTLEQVLVGFGRWDEILALPEPDQKFKLHRAIRHYARGMAFATSGEPEEALAEVAAIRALQQELGSEAAFGPFNKANDIFTIATAQIDARVAVAKGNYDRAITLLLTVLPTEDHLRYMEPPDWYLYTREMLGGAYLSAGRFTEAEEVFREDLRRNHRKGRSLFGLVASLEKQGRKSAARMVRQGFNKAWENADLPLEPEHIGWIERPRSVASK